MKNATTHSHILINTPNLYEYLGVVSKGLFLIAAPRKKNLAENDQTPPHPKGCWLELYKLPPNIWTLPGLSYTCKQCFNTMFSNVEKLMCQNIVNIYFQIIDPPNGLLKNVSPPPVDVTSQISYLLSSSKL